MHYLFGQMRIYLLLHKKLLYYLEGDGRIMNPRLREFALPSFDLRAANLFLHLKVSREGADRLRLQDRTPTHDVDVGVVGVGDRRHRHRLRVGPASEERPAGPERGVRVPAAGSPASPRQPTHSQRWHWRFL